MAEANAPKWRVKFWFLDLDKGGWVSLEYAHVPYEDREVALVICTQRAVRLGFTVNKDTKIRVDSETGDLS